MTGRRNSSEKGSKKAKENPEGQMWQQHLENIWQFSEFFPIKIFYKLNCTLSLRLAKYKLFQFPGSQSH